jgi:hypothetical protein
VGLYPITYSGHDLARQALFEVVGGSPIFGLIYSDFMRFLLTMNLHATDFTVMRQAGTTLYCPVCSLSLFRTTFLSTLSDFKVSVLRICVHVRDMAILSENRFLLDSLTILFDVSSGLIRFRFPSSPYEGIDSFFAKAARSTRIDADLLELGTRRDLEGRGIHQHTRDRLSLERRYVRNFDEWINPTVHPPRSGFSWISTSFINDIEGQLFYRGEGVLAFVVRHRLVMSSASPVFFRCVPFRCC